MGLDMYLTAKRYVSDYNDQDKVLGTELMRHFPELRPEETVRNIEVRLGYWRKSNAIHKWFVDNVQEGKDDCGSYWCSSEKLVELRDRCQRILDFRHLAVEQLPTQEGFFFGSTDYDEWYFKDVERTRDIMIRALELQESGGWDIEYQSSW
jgi:hypothetical protein